MTQEQYTAGQRKFQHLTREKRAQICRFTIDVLQKDKKTSDEWEILCYS